MASLHATDQGNAVTQEFGFDQAGVATLGRILSTSEILSRTPRRSKQWQLT
jgi:hypothetical protein